VVSARLNIPPCSVTISMLNVIVMAIKVFFDYYPISKVFSSFSTSLSRLPFLLPCFVICQSFQTISLIISLVSSLLFRLLIMRN
jgi:hypothetical protein